jgi:hypothetical protein
MMTVIGFEHRNYNSVGILYARDTDGRVWRVGVDHRPFDNILDGLSAADDVEIDPDPWQLLGTISDEERKVQMFFKGNLTPIEITELDRLVPR